MPKDHSLANKQGTVAHFKKIHNINDDQYYSDMYAYNQEKKKIKKPPEQRNINPEATRLDQTKRRDDDVHCCIIS